MTGFIVVIGSIVSGQAKDAADEPSHAANAIYQAVRSDGLEVSGVKVSLPAPRLRDGVPAEAEREALRTIAGSEGGAAELTRNSVTAPFILKTHDKTAGDRGIIRVADLWFVVHARLDAINPDKPEGSVEEGKTVEAGNMSFRGERLTGDVLKERGLNTGEGERTRFVHTTGRLLDRIHVEATDRITASKSDASWVFASRTEPRFADDKTFPNRWHPIALKSGREEAGKAEPYPGEVNYVKISRLETVPGALLVEAHFAFFEPRAWFDGAPILRSKIGVVAQDRIRALRRDLAKSQKASGPRSTSGPGTKGR